MNKAVFVDRDGAINRDVPYCSRPEDFELLPTVGKGIRLLNEHDFKVVVITNQSGIARGYFTEEMLERIHERMCSELAIYGAHVDAIYYCPHHPNDNCECRKPKPKMILQAASDMGIDLRQSYVVGDSKMDVEMGRHVGCKTILIAEENQEMRTSRQTLKPDYIVPIFSSAAQWIITNPRSSNVRSA